MITTICLNPSFDKTVTLEQLEIGEVNRIQSSRVDMGGKGLNVAVVASRLGVEVQCIGCMGETGSDMLDAMMHREGLKHRFVRIPGEVRTNTKIICTSTQVATELNEPGAPMTEKGFAEFCALAEEASRESLMVVLTGSLPPNCPVGTYKTLIEKLGGAGCILDAVGQELILGAQAAPYLIKPNKTELEQTIGRELRTMREIRDAAMEFIDKGVKYVAVSMGRIGAILVSEKKTLFAPALKLKVGSTVGAGDSMIGGFLKGITEEKDMDRAFRYGVAAASACVLTEGTQLVRREDFDMLLDKVRVQEL
ncbi:MAG: 1-phosphofructokinase family hexose kinase [Clostridia bacterium]|nr:1-phosphofructokinase family hexose kinase [Clostridia bacterium]